MSTPEQLPKLNPGEGEIIRNNLVLLNYQCKFMESRKELQEWAFKTSTEVLLYIQKLEQEKRKTNQRIRKLEWDANWKANKAVGGEQMGQSTSAGQTGGADGGRDSVFDEICDEELIAAFTEENKNQSRSELDEVLTGETNI